MFCTGPDPTSSELRRALRKQVVAIVAAAGCAAGGAILTSAVFSTAHARTDSGATTAVVGLASLPPEAQTTHRLVLGGGPFPYDKDGTVFGNRERQLPPYRRGHYREYTVPTPKSRDRGARRIVCGGMPPTRPQACYYTDDHYSSFSRIVP